MQTPGPLFEAVAVAEIDGALLMNRAENIKGTVRLTVTVTVVALGGVLPAGP